MEENESSAVAPAELKVIDFNPEIDDSEADRLELLQLHLLDVQHQEDAFRHVNSSIENRSTRG